MQKYVLTRYGGVVSTVFASFSCFVLFCFLGSASGLVPFKANGRGIKEGARNALISGKFVAKSCQNRKVLFGQKKTEKLIDNLGYPDRNPSALEKKGGSACMSLTQRGGNEAKTSTRDRGTGKGRKDGTADQIGRLGLKD